MFDFVKKFNWKKTGIFAAVYCLEQPELKY